MPNGLTYDLHRDPEKMYLGKGRYCFFYRSLTEKLGPQGLMKKYPHTMPGLQLN